MLYSKNGSIPKPQTDGTEGWIEVEEAPVAGDGQEVVWWFPPGWVVRPIKPAEEEGFVWDWSQSEEKWVKSEINVIVITPDIGVDTMPSASSNDTITLGSAAETISGA